MSRRSWTVKLRERENLMHERKHEKHDNVEREVQSMRARTRIKQKKGQGDDNCQILKWTEKLKFDI